MSHIDILNHSKLFTMFSIVKLWFIVNALETRTLLSKIWSFVCTYFVYRRRNLTLIVILESELYWHGPWMNPKISIRMWSWIEMMLRDCLVTTRWCFEKLSEISPAELREWKEQQLKTRKWGCLFEYIFWACVSFIRNEEGWWKEITHWLLEVEPYFCLKTIVFPASNWLCICLALRHGVWWFEDIHGICLSY